MRDPEDTLRRVVIRNSDNHTNYEFYLVDGRYAALKELIRSTPELPTLDSWGDGVDSSAVLGMGIIFDTVPQKFPVTDILNWLHQDIDPSLPKATIEAGLVLYARKYVHYN